MRIFGAFWIVLLGAFSAYFFGTTQTTVHGQSPYLATTTLEISICGDGIIQPEEICDAGDPFNTGAYATSSADKVCANDCQSFGPFCGDGNLAPFFGEECDDGNNISGDRCDALCQNEDSPTQSVGGTGGGGGGGGGSGSSGGADSGDIDIDAPTEVNISGLAYPGATISILIDGEVEEVVEANSSGEFDHEFTSLTPGATTFGFWAEDSDERRSLTFSTTFEVIENAITTLSGIYIPPTIAVDPTQVALGQPVTFTGEAAPDMDVITSIDNGTVLATTTSSGGGAWLLSVTTNGLDNESFHNAKAWYQDPDNSQIESGFSQLVSFYVGVQDVDAAITPDINRDGRVDLVDFSIFVFNWNTNAVIADFNQDGTVDLADFSIMLFAWTG